MKQSYCLSLMVVLAWATLSFAQEPLAPPPLPDTGKGWMDLIFKSMPVIWGIASPFATQYVRQLAPKYLGNIPSPVLGVISGVLGVLGGALVSNTGAVQPDVAMMEGGLAALASHKVSVHTDPAEPVVPVIAKE